MRFFLLKKYPIKKVLLADVNFFYTKYKKAYDKVIYFSEM